MSLQQFCNERAAAICCVQGLNAVHFAGKFYTVVTGSSEKRWEKMEDRLGTAIKSFQLLF